MTGMDPGVWEALRAGFMLPEMVIWGGDRKELDRHMTDVAHQYSEAFHEGASLKKMAMFVFTADHESDFEQDAKNYDAVATHINEKYGEVAVSYTEASRTAPLALGLIEHLYCPWGDVAPSGD